MQPDPHALQVSVDGSCLAHQGRRSGYAGIVQWPDGARQEIIFSGYEESTINRMELAACIAALAWVIDKRPQVHRVQVFSDSQYVIDSIPRAPYWQRDRWRNLEGRPIEHPDLWKAFLSARAKTRVRIDFGKVQGKSTALLKMVDRLAREAARTGTKIDRGLIVGKIGRAKTRGGGPTMFPAKGDVIAIRIYGSRVVGKTEENRFKFEVYDEAAQQCGAKFFAYAQPNVGGELHRHHAYRVHMSNNPKYPQILAVLEEIPLPTKRKTPTSAKVVSISAAAKP
jgi:ribonuclease HI